MQPMNCRKSAEVSASSPSGRRLTYGESDRRMCTAWTDHRVEAASPHRPWTYTKAAFLASPTCGNVSARFGHSVSSSHLMELSIPCFATIFSGTCETCVGGPKVSSMSSPLSVAISRRTDTSMEPSPWSVLGLSPMSSSSSEYQWCQPVLKIEPTRLQLLEKQRSHHGLSLFCIKIIKPGVACPAAIAACTLDI